MKMKGDRYGFACVCLTYKGDYFEDVEFNGTLRPCGIVEDVETDLDEERLGFSFFDLDDETQAAIELQIKETATEDE